MKDIAFRCSQIVSPLCWLRLPEAREIYYGQGLARHILIRFYSERRKKAKKLLYFFVLSLVSLCIFRFSFYFEIFRLDFVKPELPEASLSVFVFF